MGSYTYVGVFRVTVPGKSCPSGCTLSVDEDTAMRYKVLIGSSRILHERVANSN